MIKAVICRRLCPRKLTSKPYATFTEADSSCGQNLHARETRSSLPAHCHAAATMLKHKASVEVHAIGPKKSWPPCEILHWSWNWCTP